MSHCYIAYHSFKVFRTGFVQTDLKRRALQDDVELDLRNNQHHHQNFFPDKESRISEQASLPD